MPSPPRSHSLRLGRTSERGRVYLVTFTTESRRPLFSCFYRGRLLVDEIRRAQQQGLVASQAWVIMPDHFHWLLELKAGSLAHLIKQVKACSARSINLALQRKGSVWQQGFHDRAIRYDEDILKAARYIILNPVRAGLVKRVGDYSLWDAVWV